MLETIKIKEEITEIRSKMEAIKEKVISEQREMTSEEEEELDALRAEIDEKDEELKQIREDEEKQIKEHEETKACDDEEKEEDKRKLNKYISRNKKMKKEISLVREIRNAIDENKKSVIVAAETRAAQVTGDSGVHDEVIETEITGILEPLYANSVLTKLGARWFPGLPHGDVQIPVMGKQTVKWEGETDAADSTQPTFTTVKLSPKRLSAYVDISKQLIYQDTIGVEAAIRRDLVNALNDKLEATLFGSAAGSTEQPAGLFYNASETNVDDFAGLCAFEAAVENQNVYGNMKYVMNPSAKAVFRSMIKGQTAPAGFVYEAGEMDGVETYVTTNVASKKFIYGDFSNLVVGSWGDVEITVDPYTQAVNGCVRLIINAYFDFKTARSVAFNFGNVD